MDNPEGAMNITDWIMVAATVGMAMATIYMARATAQMKNVAKQTLQEKSKPFMKRNANITVFNADKVPGREEDVYVEFYLHFVKWQKRTEENINKFRINTYNQIANIEMLD